MDSKLQKRAIWITILGVVFVLVMVLAVNWNAIRSMFGNMDILSENGTITETMNSNIQESQVENDYRSFLQDDNFFDKEIEPMTKVSRAPSLSLLVTSVEKDLRVEVLDEEGRLVKGIGFFITILNQGEYKDLDQDGIIYVAGLKPGE